MSSRYTVDDLLHVMASLRHPETGCPWDIKQTFQSIVPSTVEEVFELVDAIERDDIKHLSEELGDVLFQVIFYAQLGSEQQRFDFNSIVHQLTEKLIRRHPHVFAARQAGITEAEVKTQWEAIKQEERRAKQQRAILDDIPLSLPALSRAQKLQKRAASVGFDWSEMAMVIAQFRSELDELEVAIASGSKLHMQDEMGDVLFSAVNVARHLKLDAEQCLRAGNAKFERRFNDIEQTLAEEGRQVNETDLAELDKRWQLAKQKGL